MGTSPPGDGVVRGPSVVELEWPVVAEDVLERFGNLFGMTAEPFLEVRLAGQRFRRVGDETARGLGPRCEELQEERNSLVRGERVRLDCVDEHGEQPRAFR